MRTLHTYANILCESLLNSNLTFIFKKPTMIISLFAICTSIFNTNTEISPHDYSSCFIPTSHFGPYLGNIFIGLHLKEDSVNDRSIIISMSSGLWYFLTLTQTIRKRFLEKTAELTKVLNFYYY